MLENQTSSAAFDALKLGKAIRRKLWGDHFKLSLKRGARDKENPDYAGEMLNGVPKRFFEEANKGTPVQYPTIQIIGENEKGSMWAANPNDILAEDWIIED